MGLGSGRRAMKSPPLLIAVLIACVFVLGINYWITSTRCVELQSRVMELEGRIRRAAAERGAVEMKKNEFEDMLSKQKKQIDTIQSLHSSQMQNVHLLCKSEKENLLSNLTNKDRLIQNLQDEMANVQKQLEESKLEFKELQESQAKKLSFELTQCSNKIAEVNEQCEEKIRRLSAKDVNAVNDDEEKATILTGDKKIKPVTSKEDINQKVIDIEEQKNKGVVLTAAKPSENSKKEDVPLPEIKEQTKKVNVVDEKKPSPSPQQVKIQEEKEKEKAEEDEVEAHNEVNPNLANADEEDDELKVEDVEDPNKDIENYEVERENLINMDGQTENEKVTKPIQQEEEGKNDYNGDEANEAESETDKQVELGANDQNLRGVKNEKELYGLALNQQAEEGDDPRLK